MSFKRIAIIGNAASGKTRLAKRWGLVTSLPVVHVDSIQFRLSSEGQLIVRPFNESVAELELIQNQDVWIIEGYGPLDILQKRFELADHIVLIDLPLWIHYWWACKRIFKLLFFARDEMPRGAKEFRWKHIKKLFDSIDKHHRLMRPELLRILNRPTNFAKVKIISDVAALNKFSKHLE